MKAGPPSTKQSAVWILCLAAVLWLFLEPIRGRIMGYGYDDEWLRRPWFVWPRVILGGSGDALFIVMLTAVFLGLLFLFRTRPGAQRWLRIGFVTAVLFTFFLGLVNQRFMYLMGRPFNYQWLYYSDFLQSVDSHQAIFYQVTWWTVLLAPSAAVAIVGLSVWAGRVLHRQLERSVWQTTFWTATAMVCCAYLVLGQWWVGHAVARRYWRTEQFENAIVAFADSLIEHRHKPSLFTAKTGARVDELRPVSERPPEPTVHPWGTNSPVRNVILFVLESVPAGYTEPFGCAYPVTPTMSRHRTEAALFSCIYAHAPNTLKTLFSLETSVYPWVSYRFITADHPSIALPTLTSELKRRGYRTAYFNSADNRFQNMGVFLARHGIDHIEDWRDRHCERPPVIGSTHDWPFLDGSDDKCTVDSLNRWLDEKPGEPFCAMLWTVMTHYPYFAGGDERDYGVADREFNRYLNGLRESDAALDKLLRHLKERGLAESTLVVVLGDHGEAFGQHHKRTHSSVLYEETLRVPLMLINPRLFAGETYPVLGGIVDVPATVLDILGHPLPAPWQGRSLFSAHRPARVYFFSPWSDYWFGYREGRFAFLYDASVDRAEMYDLENDPREQTNLVRQADATIQPRLDQIAAWIQYQNEYIRRLVAAPAGVALQAAR